MIRFENRAIEDSDSALFIMSEINLEPFDLNRFLDAQSNTYDRALAEIRRGRKTSHWMWFIFPQVAGLGNSEMSRRYAVQGIDEARSYLAHPVLGFRLRECVSTLMNVEDRTALDIFGSIDEMKLRSSLTLFKAASEETIFGKALEKYFDGEMDSRTLEILDEVA